MRNMRTMGKSSAGSLLSLCASSSLYDMRWAMSMSQKYCLTRTFSRIWSLATISVYVPVEGLHALSPVNEDIVNVKV